MDAMVWTAGISGVAVVLAAAIPAWVSVRNKKLKEDLETANRRLKAALGDIEFLLEVEAEFERQWRDVWQESGKTQIRRQVKEAGLNWSGRFTNSGIQSMRQRLDNTK